LHAERLALAHPITAQQLQWQAELPVDLAELLKVLSEDGEIRHE